MTVASLVDVENQCPVPVCSPAARRDEDCVETHHGEMVADPYRWLEDPRSSETAEFIDAQARFAQEYLDQQQERPRFKDLLTSLEDYEYRSAPSRHGDYYYFSGNSGLQAKSIVYQQSSFDTEPVVFIDPNTFSESGNVSLAGYPFSPDGTVAAVVLTENGSDWRSVRLMRADRPGELGPVEITGLKFNSPYWTRDNQGFFYTRYMDPAKANLDGQTTESSTHGTIYYHRVGTPQTQDQLIYAEPDQPNLLHSVVLSDDDDQRFLLLYSCQGASNSHRVMVWDRSTENGTIQSPVFRPIISDFKCAYKFISAHGPCLYFITQLDAPRWRIVKYDVDQPADGFQNVIPQHPTDILKAAAIAYHQYLVVLYQRHAVGQLSLHDRETGKCLGTIRVPSSSISGILCKRRFPTFYFAAASSLRPVQLLQYTFPEAEPPALTPEVYFTGLSKCNFDPSKYETRQVFYPSYDGTLIPLFVTCRRDLVLDGSHPAILYAYGGFGSSVSPGYNISRLAFMLAFDGVIVVAGIRGGGEYGQTWHDAGKGHSKQTCFDDFQAAAQWLVAQGYTCPRLLAIRGASNGGLLVGACINQRPDLFGAAIPEVGVHDMLRFHRFTIGHAWTSEYGDPNDATDFAYIRRYSPLHNIQTSRPYPAILLLTADHDNRVSPLHSFKFAAALQHAVAKSSPGSTRAQPILLKVGRNSGHGGPTTIQKSIDYEVDVLCFLALVLQQSVQKTSPMEVIPDN
ncbi:prolyl endopeptidase-like protein [Dimargaris cristalligena]|uniref:Prolyl endopeptidase n=1 Tax=Dimargaris cristalligena TaxID=215637 RepID=A0A4P9ZTB9_9FUNG|nr:prolyl endopeptidase-like protein [Dimargaris cristalligena]|eukprot:RKP35770.1 prolyl endopeptidase-like protein [Dimargaris cristalligena]